MALSSNRGYLMLSEPVPVQLCGFFTNTYILGRFGWHLAMDDDFRDPLGKNAILHHKKLGLSLFGRFNGIEDYRRDRMERAFNFGAGSSRFGSGSNLERQSDAWYAAEAENRPHIEIQRAAMAHTHVVRMPELLPTMTWRDTAPEYAEVGSAGELHRLPLFAQLYAARPETQELIVEPQDVQALLDQILAVQGPQQREIRARDRRRERDAANEAPRQVHAQIVSLHAA